MEIFKYAIIGGLCTLFDFLCFFIYANLFHYNYLMVSTISFSIAVFINYFLCINFLFVSGNRFSKRVEVISLFIISTIGLGIHQAILYCSVDLAERGLITAKVIATGIVFIWNYLGRKHVVFSPSKNLAEDNGFTR